MVVFLFIVRGGAGVECMPMAQEDKLRAVSMAYAALKQLQAVSECEREDVALVLHSCLARVAVEQSEMERRIAELEHQQAMACLRQLQGVERHLGGGARQFVCSHPRRPCVWRASV